MNKETQAPSAASGARAAISPTPVYVISPSGPVMDTARLEAARRNLAGLGYPITLDRSALARQQRFAGTDAMRAACFARAAAQSADIVMISRGGYGLTRILGDLDFPTLARSGKRWVGFSDFTAFQLAMLAKARAVTWAGPSLLESFGESEVKSIDEFTLETFDDAMQGRLQAIGFDYKGPKGIDEEGTLWGGNLTVLCALLGTPWFPRVKGGILFLEDVNEHPYRVERNLIQLWQSGVLEAQKVIVLGYFNGYKLYPVDDGYDMPAVIKWLRGKIDVPIITGLPFGHVMADPDHPLELSGGRYDTRMTLPHGAKVGIGSVGRTCYLTLPHAH